MSKFFLVVLFVASILFAGCKTEEEAVAERGYSAETDCYEVFRDNNTSFKSYYCKHTLKKGDAVVTMYYGKVGHGAFDIERDVYERIVQIGTPSAAE